MAERRELLRQDPFGSKGHGTAAATGFGLGALSMAGVALALCGPAAAGPFGAYVALLALFHQLEYICVAAYRADTLSFDCASTHRPPVGSFRAPLPSQSTDRGCWPVAHSFRHQPQHGLHHSGCDELGGVRYGAVALPVLDWLVRASRRPSDCRPLVSRAVSRVASFWCRLGRTGVPSQPLACW